MVKFNIRTEACSVPWAAIFDNKHSAFSTQQLARAGDRLRPSADWDWVWVALGWPLGHPSVTLYCTPNLRQ